MSTLKVDQIQDTGGGNSFAPSSINTGLIKAWVNFRGGNGNTHGINDSFGVTSVTDNNTGHYFINFSSNWVPPSQVVKLNTADMYSPIVSS